MPQQAFRAYFYGTLFGYVACDHGRVTLSDDESVSSTGNRRYRAEIGTVFNVKIAHTHSTPTTHTHTRTHVLASDSRLLEAGSDLGVLVDGCEKVRLI